MNFKHVWLISSVMMAVLLWAGRSSEGALLGYEPFDGYAAGESLNELDGGDGWTGPWFAEPAVTVETKTLAFDGETGGTRAGLIGGAVFTHITSRPFAPVDSNLYMGVLIRTEEWDDDFIQLQVSNGATGDSVETMTIGVDGRNAAGFYSRIGHNSLGSSFSTGAIHEIDTDYLLVGKFSKDGGSATYNRVDLFVNPTGTTEPDTPDATREGIESPLSELSMFTVRTALMEGPELFFLDELRLATSFTEVLLSELPDAGDFNADGVVNRDDFAILRTNFKEPGDFFSGDMNFDGVVDLHDFGAFVTVYNAANPAQVPEPASGALLGLGSALLLGLARRRRSSAPSQR